MQFLLGEFQCKAFFKCLIFKFLKVFVFLLCMKALRHSGCWRGNNTLIVLLDNNWNNAFTGIKGSFFDVFPPDIKSLKKVEEKGLKHF